MKPGAGLAILAVVLLSFVPDPASALDRSATNPRVLGHPGGPSMVGPARSVFPHALDPRRFPDVDRHHPVRRPRARFPVVAVTPAPIIVYSSPEPAMYAVPSPVAIPAPAPPAPMPSVVEYSTGRYELRGDGITAPYLWVWVPKPPSSPPTAPPPPPPASSEASPAPEAAVPAEPAPRAEIYRWTDEHGVTTWTDRPDKIPERYRAQAVRM